jgi:glycosyltransferase involved in cell wall biosynthesis
MAGVVCHSVFPSRVQRFTKPDVRVFELDHDIPICESVSPVSSFRWHAMSEDEFEAYRVRLRDFVLGYIDEVEQDLGRSFDLFIAHHSFLNPLVMADVNRVRVERGQSAVPLFAFVHGTALLMFRHEMDGVDPAYPPRFYPRWIRDRVFGDVNGVFVISDSQRDRFLSVFDEYDSGRVFVAPNGIDPSVFQVDETLTRGAVLSQYQTKPYEGSSQTPAAIPPGYDRMVLYVGKFADIKRIDCLLRAAVDYERVAEEAGLSVATVIAGSGPLEDQKLYQDLAVELGLSGAHFVGPLPQLDLAQLYNVADLGVFPTKIEAFGLVFLECMACGTPVVGTAAGGPLEFVDDRVGELVTDFDANADFTVALGETIGRALTEDWKQTKSAAAVEVAAHYTLIRQCERMLEAVDSVVG